MKRFLSLLVLTGFVISFHVRAQIITFRKTFGGSMEDRGYSVCQTFDGGYIFGGTTTSFGAGNYDVYLIKTDAAGNSEWTKTIGGTGADDVKSILQTPDSGYIMTGRTISLSGGVNHIYIIKTTSNGTTIWTKTISDVDDLRGASIVKTTDGNYYVVGGGYGKVSQIKISNSGVIIWNKQLTIGASGGSGIQTSDGGYAILAGEGIRLIKTDTAGNETWTKIISSNMTYLACALSQTTDNGYLLLGSTPFPNSNLYLVKTNSSGDPLWTKQPFPGIGYAISPTSDGNYIITGNNTGALCLFKIDPNGNTLWIKNYGGFADNVGYSVKETSDGGFVAVGSTTQYGAGAQDFYAVKTDSSGRSVGGINNSVKSENELFIYPNPFSKSATLFFKNSSGNDHYSIEIYSVLGKIIMTQKFYDFNNIVIEKGNLPAGIYFIKLLHGNELAGTIRFIIE